MKWLALMLVMVVAAPAFGLERKAVQMRQDFSSEQSYDCMLQYYYYIPCPTYSWFWSFSGWSPGDIVGKSFALGDQGTGGHGVCDPYGSAALEQIRVLDFAGYGTVYPGLFTVEFKAWCTPCPLTDENLLWSSGPVETGYGWNYISVEPACCLTDCAYSPEDYMILITATMTGTDALYPAWGTDNVSEPVESGCAMHDIGCLPAVYPRTSIHSGYLGNFDPCQYDPPLPFCDAGDTGECGMYGPVELAWTMYLGSAAGVTPGDSDVGTTWGGIKTLYR